MANELIKKVQEEVNNSGIPLEMYSAQRFIKAGWKVDHLTHYNDEESNKLREIDLVCSPPYIDNVNVVVSCKTSSKNHWILHTIKNPLIERGNIGSRDKGKINLKGFIETPFIIEPGFLHNFLSTELPFDLWSYLFEKADVLKAEGDIPEDVNLNKFREYWMPEHISVFQSVMNRGPSDDLPIRIAGLSSISAIMSLSNFTTNPDDYPYMWLDKPKAHNLNLWFPLIIFGGKIFEAYYGDKYENVKYNNGKVTADAEVKEKKRVRCTFATSLDIHPYHYNYSMFGIDIITPDYIDYAINSIINAVNLLYEKNLLDKIAQDFGTYLKVRG